MSKKPPSKVQPKSRRSTAPSSDMQRLQRVLAAAGFGSRRECETFIEEGRVEVDGKVADKLGTKVNPDKQEIYVDGQKLTMARRQYFVLNKPPGIVSTSKDPSGRLRVVDLIKTDQRVYNVGRLDQSSEGLILVTNDGDLANLLTHPRYGVAKKYLVQVQGTPTAAILKSLTEGIYLAEGKARVANIKLKRRVKDTSWLEIVLEEGRNREIRRLLARVGHKVLRLRRIAIGPLKLGGLPIGAHRALTAQEVRELKKAVSGTPVRRKRVRRSPHSKPKGSSTDRRARSKTAVKKKSAKRTKSLAGAKKVRSAAKGRSTARVSEHRKPTKKKRSVMATSKKKSSKPVRGKPKRAKKRG